MISTSLGKVTQVNGLGELPIGWKWIPLGLICEKIIGGGTPDRKNPSYWGGSIPWASVKDLKHDEIVTTQESITLQGLEHSSTKLVEPGTIIIATRIGLGKVSIAKTKLAINQDLKGLVIAPNILGKYLMYNLKSRALEIEGKGYGATVKGIKIDEVKSLKIPIPFPNNLNLSREIQHRIVSRIESLLGELKGDHQLLDKMRRDTSRVMEATLTELINEIDKKYPDSPSLGELLSRKYIKILGGGTPSKEKEEYWGGSIPWTSPRDMKRWYIDTTYKYISQTALQEKKLNLVPEGSVLIVVRGMILAHTLPVGVTKNEVTINQDMKALVPEKNILAEYLGYILRARAPLILQQVETAAHGTRRLKTDTLKNVVIPIVSISEQRTIIEHLNFFQTKVYEMGKIMQQDAQLLERLEQSILEKAFQGQL